MTRKAKSESERQQARYLWLSPTEAGERIGGVSDEQVRTFIASGELTAMDVAKKGAKPMWKIAPEWVDDFIRRRTRNAAA